jgi:hypothetical protein
MHTAPKQDRQCPHTRLPLANIRSLDSRRLAPIRGIGTEWESRSLHSFRERRVRLPRKRRRGHRRRPRAREFRLRQPPSRGICGARCGKAFAVERESWNPSAPPAGPPLARLHADAARRETERRADVR